MSNTAMELTKLFYSINSSKQATKDEIILTYLYFNELLMRKIGEQFDELMREKGVKPDE